MSEGLNGVPEEEIAKFEQQRKEHQEHWEEAAKGQNAQRSLKEKLLSRNKTTAEDIMLREANAENMVFDSQQQELQRKEAEEKRSGDLSELGQSLQVINSNDNEPLSQEALIRLGFLHEKISSGNYEGIRELYATAKNESDIPEKLVGNKLRELIKEKNGAGLKLFYQSLARTEQPEDDQNYSENKASFEVALDKLAIITRSDFKNFAVRFMNFGEFETIMQQHAYNGEVSRIQNVYKTWGGQDAETPSLPEYIGKKMESWAKEAGGRTDERENVWGLQIAELFPYIYKTALRIAKKEEGSAYQIVADCIKDPWSFYKENKDIIDSDDKFSRMFYKLMQWHQIKKAGTSPVHDDLIDASLEYISDPDGYQADKSHDDLIDLYGNKNLEIVGNFLANPQNFDHEKFRIFASSFMQNFGGAGFHEYGLFNSHENRQYQMMAIYSPNVVGGHLSQWDSGQDTWGSITEGAGGSGFLGAVTLINDNSFVQRAQNVSMNQQDFTPVILDKNGNIRFPSIEILKQFTII